MLDFLKKKKTDNNNSCETTEPEKMVSVQEKEDRFIKLTEEEYREIISTLTPSELRVYNEMVRGFKAAETAERLNLKKYTVDSYLKVIYKKLNVHTVVEMILTYGPMFNKINNNE